MTATPPTQAQRIIAAELLKPYAITLTAAPKDKSRPAEMQIDLGTMPTKKDDLTLFNTLQSVKDALRYFAADERTQDPAEVSIRWQANHPEKPLLPGGINGPLDFHVDARRLASVTRFVDSETYLSHP